MASAAGSSGREPGLRNIRSEARRAPLEERHSQRVVLGVGHETSPHAAPSAPFLVSAEGGKGVVFTPFSNTRR